MGIWIWFRNTLEFSRSRRTRASISAIVRSRITCTISSVFLGRELKFNGEKKSIWIIAKTSVLIRLMIRIEQRAVRVLASQQSRAPIANQFELIYLIKLATVAMENASKCFMLHIVHRCFAAAIKSCRNCISICCSWRKFMWSAAAICTCDANMFIHQ